MELKDKVVFAGAIAAAALAVAKLVADKESKISDARLEWINGFRDALCECLSSAHVIAGRIKIRRMHGDGVKIIADDVRALEAELTEHWAQFRQAFQMTMLHLNFSETNLVLLPMYQAGHSLRTDSQAWDILSSTPPGRAHSLYIRAALPSPTSSQQRRKQASPAKTELASTLVELRSILLGNYADVGIGERYKKIEDCILKATMLGTLVIEPEWTRIKRGEFMHRWAIRASAALVAFGAYKLLTA